MKPTHGSAPVVAVAAPPAELVDALVRMRLVAPAEPLRLEPLPGGVSSDIWRVDAAGRTFCVKRALPKLKVVAEWHAPVERNRYEVAWMREAATLAPGAVPEILGEDGAAGAFAMAWLPPDRYPVWKSMLAAGVAAPATAAAVGNVLGRIHAGTADRRDLAERFRTDDIFHAIRLEPYLIAAARAHPALGPRLAFVASITAATKRVLVHGDFSPKNLLAGPDGPVVLDAECAWFGDPAFDLAFVLNHLLLKAAWRPGFADRYAAAFEALVDGYHQCVDWEPWSSVEHRTAALLPALMLARIDGKSPVEYLTSDADKARIRAFAAPRILRAASTLHDLLRDWQRESAGTHSSS